MGLPLTELPKVYASTIFDVNIKGAERSYALKKGVLPANECHMFFPNLVNIELLVLTALEYHSFHPWGDKATADLYQIKTVACGNITLLWCSFPKEYEDTCKRIAAVYNMTVKTTNRVMLQNKTKVSFPNLENVLLLEGPRNATSEVIDRECTLVRTLAARGNVPIESLKPLPEA